MEQGIFTDGMTEEELINNIHEAVECHFDVPYSDVEIDIRLHPDAGKTMKMDSSPGNSEAIRMVEGFVEKNSGYYKRRALWQHLPSRIAYQLYKQIIDYLIRSDKIIVDSKGFVCWIPVSGSKKKYAYDDRLLILKK
jgi:hypothetical protein